MSSFRNISDIRDIRKLLDEIALDTIPETHPVRRFNHFWQMNLNKDGIFLRDCFDPAKAKNILPWVVILETIKGEENAFRYRLCGTGFTRLVGIELTGTKVGELINDEAAQALKEIFLRAIGNGKPFFSKSSLPIENRRFIQVYRGMFPVSSNGKSLDMVFAIVGQETLTIPALSVIQKS